MSPKEIVGNCGVKGTLLTAAVTSLAVCLLRLPLAAQEHLPSFKIPVLDSLRASY